MPNDEKFILVLNLLGKHIRKLREERKFTIEDISSKTNIAIRYLKKIEKGQAKGVRVFAHLAKIAGALNVELYQLIDFWFCIFIKL